MSTFSRVYKPYTFGGGGVNENHTYFVHFQRFGQIFFIIFMFIFGTQKMLMCTLCLGGERGVLESVWFVHS